MKLQGRTGVIYSTHAEMLIAMAFDHHREGAPTLLKYDDKGPHNPKYKQRREQFDNI